MIRIQEGSNIQDGAILHTDPGIELRIGKNVTVGHAAILHGCEIGDHSLIGMGSTVLNHVKIGKGVIVGANSLVTETKIIPDYCLVMGSPAKIIKEIPKEISDQFQKGVESYKKEALKYLYNQ